MEQFFGHIIIFGFAAAAIWGGLDGLHHAGDTWRERHGEHVSKDIASYSLVVALILLVLAVIGLFLMREEGKGILIVPLTVGLYYLHRCIHLLEGDHPAA